MSRRERRICANARKVLKMQRWIRRTGGPPQDPGFFAWLEKTGRVAGNAAIWAANNVIAAWNLYQTYQQLTGLTGGGTMGTIPPIPKLPTNGQQFSNFTGGFQQGGGGFGSGFVPSPQTPFAPPSPAPTPGMPAPMPEPIPEPRRRSRDSTPTSRDRTGLRGHGGRRRTETLPQRRPQERSGIRVMTAPDILIQN